MSQIPFALNSYTRGQGLLPRARLVNQFVEKSTGLTQSVDLLMRPSLQPVSVVGTGPCRGFIRRPGTFNGDTLMVSGTELYRVTSAGVATLVGTIPGTGIVSMAASASEVQIANGSALYTTDGVSVSPVVFPDSAGVVSVEFLSGYFLAARVDSRRMYYTDPTTGLYDVLRFVAAESSPDFLFKILRIGDEAWLFGDATVEPFQATGVDAVDNPPFQRVPGRTYDKGTINADTVCRLDNTAFWVGTGEDVVAAVYRGGSVAERISTDTVDEALERADPTSLMAWPFPFQGHLFYVLHMGSEGTWVYDVATQEWFEWASFGREKWRAKLGVVAGAGQVFAGDDETGQLWRLDWTRATDNGEPISRVFTAGVAVKGSRITCDSLDLTCAAGSGSNDANHIIRLKCSDDQGRTYWQAEDGYLGKGGEYDARVRWTRLGLMESPGRLFEWTVTDDLRTRFTGAYVNDKP